MWTKKWGAGRLINQIQVIGIRSKKNKITYRMELESALKYILHKISESLKAEAKHAEK